MSEEANLEESTEENDDEENPRESVFGEIPSDWSVSDLDDPELFSVTSSGLESFDGEKTYVPTGEVEGGEIIGDDGTVSYDDRPSRANLAVEEGDVLFAKMKDSIKVIRATQDLSEDYIFSTGFVRVTTTDSVNSDFLKQILLSNRFNQSKDSLAIGSTQPAINLSDLSALSVPVPPIDEQRKIASILYTVDQAIQKTEEFIEQTHQIKAGVVQDVFHGKHEHFDEYVSTSVGKVPSNWEVASIGDVVHTAQYGISESLSEEGEYPIFRMNNIKNGYMIDEPMKYIDLDDDELEKYRVEEGDILFNRTNSLELVGKTGIYNLDGDHVFASYLVRLQTNERSDSYYLNYYMNSAEAQNRMMDFATKGVSQANINANSIQQVKLPLPPLDEQKQIAERIRSLDRQIETNQEYKYQLNRLKNGLMHDLLSGEIRTHGKDIELVDDLLKHG